MTTILGFSITWWTGVLGGAFCVLLLLTAVIKQYNWKMFMRWQIPMTPLHHWFGWIAAGFLAIHALLAILQSSFHVYF